MRRREFIRLFSSTVVAWPLGARAQQQERVRRIGVLMNLAEDDPEASARISAFVQRLSQLGWTEGRNLQIDYRWAAGKSEWSARMLMSWLRSHRMSSWRLAIRV
jgi:putative ABC transport system substrate-binding protein